MAKFRKKPVVIDAVQWDGENVAAVNEMAGFDFTTNYERDGNTLVIFTLEGRIYATPGDWVIKGVKRELYPCKPDIFAATYEAVEG